MSAVGLPPYILALFQARPPIEYIKPLKKKKLQPYSGLAEFVDSFEVTGPPSITTYETPKQRQERIKGEKIIEHELKLKKLITSYDPRANYKSLGDPFKTLFVARINYDTTEKKLKREFEEYGSIRKVKMIYDKNNKPRGYGFVEFESDKDMKEAYKQADGKKIDGKRVLVDVERGRTISGWLPRRLGGGRGPSRGNVGKTRTNMLNDIINMLGTNIFSKLNSDSVKRKNLLDELSLIGIVNNKNKSSKRDEKEKDRDRKEKKDKEKERNERKKDKRARSKDRERKRSRSRDKERRRERSRSNHKERDRERRRDTEGR